MFWGIVLLIFIGAVVGGALIAWFIFKNVDARLILADQPVMATIVDPMDVTAKVTNNLTIGLDATIHTRVPVNQVVTVPVDDTLHILADFDAEVPIKMDVPVHETIPLDQTLNVDTVVTAQLLGQTVQIPLRGKIPVKAQVPIDLIIPVNKKVRLKFTAPVEARIKQSLTVPLNTVIEADVPIKAVLDVPVLSDLKARINFPTTPSRMVINYADLKLPLRTLQLEMSGDERPDAKESDSQQKPAADNADAGADAAADEHNMVLAPADEPAALTPQQKPATDSMGGQ